MEDFENSPEQTEVVETTDSGSTDQPTEQPKPEIIDLDSVERFKYGGREWTTKEFNGGVMMQQDYTKKTQALAEERKYYDNLAEDLDAVKANPSLIEKFKSIYPEKFHRYLGYVQTAQPAAGKAESQGSQPDPAIMQRLERIESDYNERKIEAAQSQIDATFSKLTVKYPMADEEAVIARAQALLNRGEKVTDKVWDSLFKSVHDRNQKLADPYYSKKVSEQKNANSKGKDVASGGGTPGKAPSQARTIKEASKFALEQLENT